VICAGSTGAADALDGDAAGEAGEAGVALLALAEDGRPFGAQPDVRAPAVAAYAAPRRTPRRLMVISAYSIDSPVE
jgi:hypothetical protein